MNPYLAGIVLGLVLLAAMFFSGRGLGASGGIKYAVVATVEAISPQHVQESPYYSKYRITSYNVCYTKLLRCLT